MKHVNPVLPIAVFFVFFAGHLSAGAAFHKTGTGFARPLASKALITPEFKAGSVYSLTLFHMKHSLAVPVPEADSRIPGKTVPAFAGNTRNTCTPNLRRCRTGSVSGPFTTHKTEIISRGSGSHNQFTDLFAGHRSDSAKVSGPGL